MARMAASVLVILSASSMTGAATVAHAQSPGQSSGCEPVTPVAVHRAPGSCGRSDFLGEPFLVNRRLTPIENNSVPCVDVDTMEATRCLFRTGAEFGRISRTAEPASGPWLEDAQGRPFAVVGQPVTLDGNPSSGVYVVGTVPDGAGNTPCVGATGRDAVGTVLGTDMAGVVALETGGSETNVSGHQLVNHVDRYVATTTLVHPDGVSPVATDAARGLAWYTGEGAALNDAGGAERDASGVYYPEWYRTHYVMAGGVMVPAAKRPATTSYPPPGVVNVYSRIRWLVANPYVTIANAAPVDPRRIPPPTAGFTVQVGRNTLWVDASGSTGEIVQYLWDLDWTANDPDARSSSPTLSVPIVVEGVRTSGWVTLTVVARDQQRTSVSQSIEFKPRTRLPRASLQAKVPK